MAIKQTAGAARAAGYRHPGKKPLSPQPGGERFQPKEVGDICYTGPCVDGEREVYYFSDDGCTDGPHYTSEGCD